MGTLSQLNKAEADIVGAKMDDEGIIPEELDNLIKDLLSQGRKLNIYIQFQNFKIQLVQQCLYQDEKKYLKLQINMDFQFRR